MSIPDEIVDRIMAERRAGPAMFKSDLVDAIAEIGRGVVLGDDTDLGMSYFGSEPKRRKRYRGLFVPGAFRSDEPFVRRYLAALLPDLRAAVPFVFADDVLFDDSGDYLAPRIGGDGMRLFNSGRLRPPFPATWLEYQPDGTRRNGLLVVARGGDLSVNMFADATGDGESDFYRTSCFSVTIRPTLGGDQVPQGVDERPEVFCYRVEDELGFMEREKKEFYKEIDRPAELHADGWRTSRPGINVALETPALYAVYMLLVLQSNVRRIETVKTGTIENRRRSDRGQTRIPDYGLVTMPPDWSPEQGFVAPPGTQVTT
jgi:hypothetical protein